MQTTTRLIFRGAALSLLMLLLAACTEQASTETAPAAAQPAPTPAPASEPEASVEADSPADFLPITTSNDDARALYREGMALLDVGRGVKAREKFLASVAADPGFALGHLGHAQAALSFKEFEDSVEAAEAHVEGVSEAERLWIGIARSFVTNDAAGRLQNADQIVASHPATARAYLIRAGVRGGQNQNEAAREDMKKALELEPDSAAALSGLAANYLFSEPRDFEAALQWANRYIEAYPDEAKAHEMLGDVERGLGDLDAAADAYGKAEEVDAALWVAPHKRGHVFSFLGNIEEARAAYDRGIELGTVETKAGTAIYKAFTGIHAGDVESSIAALEALADGGIEALGTPADQVKGQQVFALTSAAIAALHTDMLDKAEALIARRNELVMAIAEDVGNDDARRLQKANTHTFDGLLAAYGGDTEEAARHAAAIEELVKDDDNPRKLEPMHWVLGMAALKSGDSASAAEHLSQADHANNMFIRYQLAEAQAADGDSESAAKRYDEVANYRFNSVGFALVGREAAEKMAALSG